MNYMHAWNAGQHRFLCFSWWRRISPGSFGGVPSVQLWSHLIKVDLGCDSFVRSARSELVPEKILDAL